jgi:hypothetical protein
MTDAAQVSLLSKLDSTNFPPNTIFVFTCNDSSRLEPRFLSRFARIVKESNNNVREALNRLQVEIMMA